MNDEILEEVEETEIEEIEIPTFTMPTFKVYVKVDENNVIKAIDSDWNIQDLDEWTYIDEGYDLKYHHAQGNYLEKGLMDRETYRYNYKLVDGEVMELTEEEKEVLFPIVPIEPQPTFEDRLNELEQTQDEQATSIDDLQTQLDDFIFSQLFGEEEETIV